MLKRLYLKGLNVPEVYACELNTKYPFLLLEYLDGSPKYQLINRNETLEKMAQSLSIIHNFAPSLFSFLPSARMLRKKNNPNPDAIIQQVYPILSKNIENMSPNERVLLHGDFGPGNILWNKEKLIGIIDWEGAKLGEPLMDLSQTRLDIAIIYGFEAMDHFTHLYFQLNPLKFKPLQLWDLYSGVRLLQLINGEYVRWASFFNSLNHHEMTAERIKLTIDTFIQRALKQLN